MCAQAISEENCPPAVIVPRSPWRVASVEALPDYRLNVRFLDGMEGTVDMSALVRSADAGVFAVLADPLRFAEVFVELGVVTWPGELDLAPDAMHAEICAHGEWRLS
ncbi:MAG: DUF2442 domain-containing protein [Betaproteobacteria bacterium]|nr:DUF2442 domain-containing protein [Betaproteobacteria bacterium]